MNNTINKGGYSNTPLTNAIIKSRTLEKRVLVDWLSITIDFIEINSNGIDYFIKKDLNFDKLVGLLGYDPLLQNMDDRNGLNGYRHGLTIGEHVKLFYGSEFSKNQLGNYTMQILLSGKACREYENFLNGNFPELLKFLLSYDNTKINRIDIAIDDFKAFEIDLYEDIKELVDKNYYISPFENVMIIEKKSKTRTKGFTIEFGSKGGNQLRIYDKRLERDSANEPDLDTDIWYRYEMQFTNEKAKLVAMQYVLSVENNDNEFMSLAKGLLNEMLELKVPKSKARQRTDKTWKINPKWKNFLEDMLSVDLRVKHKVDTSIDKRKRWISRSAKKVLSTLYAAFQNDSESFQAFIYKNIIEGIEDAKIEDISMINHYRIQNGLKELSMSDYKDLMDDLKEELDMPLKTYNDDDLPF